MKYIIQKQEHSSNIKIVTKNTESKIKGDAMITDENNFALVAYGSDCAVIGFYKEGIIGICHAGWRGYSQGIVLEMAKIFFGGYCFVSPFLHRFEIKKDECYDQISKYCGEDYFFEKDSKIFFDFKGAIHSDLALIKNMEEDCRNTFESPELASWRRDCIEGYQNRLAVWRRDHIFQKKVFLPNESIEEYFKMGTTK